MKNKMNLVWPVALSILVLLLFIGGVQGEEVGVDRPGKDLRPGFDLPKADSTLCEKACNDEPNCKAYTYVKPNTIQGPNPRCWLKSEVPAAVKNDCCISGTKRTALYRFWNGKDHFYTIRCQEVLPPAQCNSGYSFEGIAGYVSIAAIENTAPLYRMLNDATGDHFYTTSFAEKEAAKPAYHQEGTEGTEGYLATIQVGGTVPLYRMFNAISGDHFYTINANERSIALQNGWGDEGIMDYIWTTGSNPCQPPPDFVPKILSFTQTVVNDDQARLYWSFKSGPCCSGKIVGYTNIDNLNSAGSKVVWRERSTYGGDTQYKLIVQCGKNQDSRTITVPKWTGGGGPPALNAYFFKATNPSSSVLPCYVFSVTAASGDDAKQMAQAQTGGYTVTQITEAQFYDPGICGGN